MMVVLLELLGDALDLLQALRPMDSEALLFVTPVVTFHMPIFLWLVRWTEAGFAPLRRVRSVVVPKENPIRWSLRREPWIVIKRQLFWATVLT